MQNKQTSLSKAILVATLLLAALTGVAQEAVIRKHLGERAPNFTPINEVTKSEVPGVYEVRINGTDIIYTDAQANYMFLGKLIDLKEKVNVTDARIARLNTVKYKELITADSVTIVRGNGSRKLAIFADPNCGYCKAFERELAKVDNITVAVYLYPVLGPDSLDKSKNLWCAPDRAKAWQDWMINNKPAPPASPDCDTASIFRTLDYGKKNAVKGTPTLFFIDDSRIPGVVETKQLEKHFAEIKN